MNFFSSSTRYQGDIKSQSVSRSKSREAFITASLTGQQRSISNFRACMPSRTRKKNGLSNACTTSRVYYDLCTTIKIFSRPATPCTIIPQNNAYDTPISCQSGPIIRGTCIANKKPCLYSCIIREDFFLAASKRKIRRGCSGFGLVEKSASTSGRALVIMVMTRADYRCGNVLRGSSAADRYIPVQWSSLY